LFGSAVLDAAVGLTLVYFLLAVIVARIQESIAGQLGWRAQFMAAGVRQMLPHKKLGERVLEHPLVTGLATHAEGPSYIPPRIFSLAVLDILGPEAAASGDTKALSEIAAREGDAALAGLIGSGNGDIGSARAAVGDWFGAAMDRVTGRYKRRAVFITTVLGAVLTVVLGADTIAITSTLVQEQGIRAAIQGTGQSASGTGLEDAFNALSSLALPLGWTAVPATPYAWFLKVVGLALTAAAVSLGAPFWFDLFKLFTNPRSSGPAPDKAVQ
jgi:hypothetical protein